MSDVPHSEGIFADTSSFPAQSCFGTETFESIVWSNLVSPLNISVVTEIHSLHSKFCVCRKNASKFLSFGKSVLFTEFLLQIAPVIFVRLKVSQFGAFGKWVNKLCFPPGLKMVPLKFCTRGGTCGVCINSTTPRGASSVELDAPSHKPLSKGFSHSGNSCERLWYTLTLAVSHKIRWFTLSMEDMVYDYRYMIFYATFHYFPIFDEEWCFSSSALIRISNLLAKLSQR